MSEGGRRTDTVRRLRPWEGPPKPLTINAVFHFNDEGSPLQKKAAAPLATKRKQHQGQNRCVCLSLSLWVPAVDGLAGEAVYLTSTLCTLLWVVPPTPTAGGN